MRKPRNYKAEYARRIERAEELGYSRDQARGHPVKGELGIHEERKIVLSTLKEFHSSTSRKTHEKLKDLVFAMADRSKELQKTFIRLALQAGFTKRQAYSLWFSP